MLAEDKNLTAHDIQAIDGRDAFVKFIASLGYDTEKSQVQNLDALGITNEPLRQAAKRIECVAVDGGLQVFLFELASVTVAHRRAISLAFNNRAGDYLFVLTTPEYERLDFFVLEKTRDEESQSSAVGGRPKVRVRPITITVERRKPDRAAIRALSRLTFTCADDLAQFEKLLSVFGIAQWSEPRFNNVALFSDHYLNNRLPEDPEWQSASDVKDAHRKARAQGDTNKVKAAKGVEEVVLPYLKLLGHNPQLAKAHDDGPVYRLDNGVVCLAYPWLRMLDTKDDNDSERPNDNPAARVVAEMLQGKAPWAILTNGKHWRLYCARAHGRHASFYEIDLRETLASDPIEAPEPDAFRYFWLLFRAKAFAPSAATPEGKPGPSFLDKLFDGSRTYAKELGDRLKSRVFEEIFPHFAEGFIAHIRAREGKDAELSEERLAEVFRATLALLYRLIFLLYAESRDLLPINERSYQEASLRALVQEIADKAGKNEDDAKRRIHAAYSATETKLFERLASLFTIIDQGDATKNVPLYNGGLFLTDPQDDDETDEAKVARFLKANKVPDRFVALGLDLLARAEDDKRHELVPVDYKSLGVRHLGSIYEGLLEFKVRVAQERMALVKDKKGELVVSAREAEKEGLKIATRVKMHGVEDGFLKKGNVYLENDKHERKATGSYYTPDYIVKYIVENTVGPVLEEKFNTLRPQFREAEALYRKHVKQREQGKKDDPEKVANDYRKLVDDLFTLRVLDPAMGSGHFLVEAVDFITDRLIAFLNEFPWNPVQAFIQRTRAEILNALDAAKVSVDDKRLTDINLLKRHVLKRCIFGVDLNPMAVELAKVSLWLDCFTLGAPLSFLDHHLKCGNSLIGVTVEEVEKTLKKAQGMFTSRFAGLMLATDIARQIASMPDTTASQAAKSRAENRRAEVALEPFKKLLNIYTSQWFGNGAVGEKSGGKAKKDGKIAAIEWLNSDAAKELFQAGQDGLVEGSAKALGDKAQKSMLDNTRQRSITDSARRKPAITDKVDSKAEAWFNNVPKVSSNAAREHRFFHWELEFSEVFYAPTTPGGQNVKRVEGAGFDAVVGNPPYINVKRGMEEYAKNFLECRYSLANGQWDQGVLFFERGLKMNPATTLIGIDGNVGLICPKPFLLSESYEPLRRAMLNTGNIVTGPCGECFDDAGVEGSICIARAAAQKVVQFVDGRTNECFNNGAVASFANVLLAPFAMFSYMMPSALYARLYSSSDNEELIPLSRVVRWTRGVEMGKRDECVLATPQKGTLTLLTGEDVTAFSAQPRLSIRFDHNDEQVFKPLRLYEQEQKLLLRRVANTLVAAVDRTKSVTLNTIYVAELLDETCPFALCALLNSNPTRSLFAAVFNHDDTLFPYVRMSQLDHLLVPTTSASSSRLSELGRQLSGKLSEDVRKKLLAELDKAVLEDYGLTWHDLPAFIATE